MNAHKVGSTPKLTPAQVLEAFHAGKRLLKEKAGDRWKLAAAAAENRHLLIGSCKVFRPPGK